MHTYSQTNIHIWTYIRKNIYHAYGATASYKCIRTRVKYVVRSGSYEPCRIFLVLWLHHVSRQQLFRVPFFDGRSRFLDANANANTLHLALTHFLSLSLPLSLFNSYITHIYSYHVSKSGAVANNIQRFTNTQVHFALECHAVFLYGGGGGGSSGRPPPQSQRCLVGFLLWGREGRKEKEKKEEKELTDTQNRYDIQACRHTGVQKC